MPTLKIDVKSPLHKKIIERVETRMKMSRAAQSKQHQRWRDAENRVVAYVPESTMDAKRRNRRDNGEPQYTTIQIPYTYAVLLTAHTYWTSVFFGRSPVHQFAGLNGTGEMQVLALESLIQYQVTAGRLLAPYYLWFYDAGKYGIGIVGEWWDKRVVQYGSLEQDPMTGEFVQVSRQVPGYQGNCIYNVSPYNWFPDPRVTVGNFQKGEFVGVEIPMAWHDLKAGEARGDYVNLEHIQQDHANWLGQGDSEMASSQVERPDESVWALASEEGKTPSRVRLLEFHVNLVPSEWGVGNARGFEKWVFTLTADLKTILGARPLGVISGEFPFGVIESEMEAYGLWGRGIPELVQPLQQTMDWLLNTHFYNIRASLNNQFVVDPTRVNMKDVEKGGPGFVFRLKPNGYGQDVRTMIHQLQVQDVTRTHVQDIDTVLALGERMLGINEQMFGVLATGGRKTATEIRTSTGFGTNRQKTQTEWMSVSGFQPHQMHLVSNTQQYYTGEKKVRIVGDAAMDAGMEFLLVTPETIAGEFDVMAVDGTLPIDRFAQVTMWKDLLGTLTQSEMGAAVLQGFDLTKLIGWVFSLGGLKNINQFKIQVLPPGQAPGGNVVPFGSSPGRALPAPVDAGAAGGLDTNVGRDMGAVG